MSAAKYTAKLTADTSQHDRALGKSKQQVYNYQRGVEKSKQQVQQFTNTVKNGAVGALTKFGSVVGVGMTAIELFNKTMKSSQTTSDAWDGVIRGCTNTVNTFFTALASGDFTNINQGLDVLISKGRKAQQALDQLGNTQISYGYFTSKNKSEYASALTRAKDKSLSQSDRNEAVAEAKAILEKQQVNVESLTAELTTTLSAIGTESNRLSNMTVERFEKVLSYDLLPSDIRTKVKERLDAEYKIYQEEIAKLDEAVKRKQTYTGYVSATGEKTVLYDMKLKELNELYQEAIDYKTWLVNKDDEQLVNATKLVTTIQDSNKALDEMKRQLLEITNQTATLANKSQTVFQPKELTTASLMDGYRDHLKYLEKQKKTNGLPDKIELNIPIVNTYEKQIEELKEIEEQAYNTSTAISTIGNAFYALGANSDSYAGKVLQSTGAMLNGISLLIPQIQALTAAKSGEALANATAEGAKQAFPINIGAIAAGAAAVISTIAQIKSISTEKYANGGIIGGSNTLGDLNLARVNKGEMILNGSQQGKLFKLLNSNITTTTNSSFSNNEVRLRVSGSDLVAVLNTQNNKSRRVI